MKSADISRDLRLYGMQVFRPNDISRMTGKGKGYVYLLLHKSKAFVRVENGLYCLPGTDPLVVASNVSIPSYVSLITAFVYYKLIDQVASTIKVITTKRHRMMRFQGTVIEFKTLRRAYMYGYGSTNGIAMASPEKAVVDALYLNEDVKYAEEALSNGLENSTISIKKLLEYAKKTGTKSIAKTIARLAK